jgi:hypothetical protein
MPKTHDHDKCGRGSGKEAPPHVHPKKVQKAERIFEHRRSHHKPHCGFCPCSGFVERLAR